MPRSFPDVTSPGLPGRRGLRRYGGAVGGACRLVVLLAVVGVLSAAVPVGAGPIVVTVAREGFADGPSPSAVRRSVAGLLEPRVARFERAEVSLAGTSSACNVLVRLLGVHLRERGSGIELAEVSFRVPAGNVRALVEGRMRWPESLLLKDLVVRVAPSRLAAALVDSVEVVRARCVPPGDLVLTALTPPTVREAQLRLARSCIDAGLALDRDGGVAVRDAAGTGLLHLVGTMPSVTGDREVEVVAVPVVAPGGRLALSVRLAGVGGLPVNQVPEVWLAEDAFSRVLGRLQGGVEDSAVCRAFLSGALVAADGGLEVRGMALLGTLQYLDVLREEKRAAGRVTGPALDLNPFR